MGKSLGRSASLIAIGILVSFGNNGCSRPPGSKDLVSLEKAYQSGVLSKEEYEAKKTGLESQAAALDALDKALAAGAVTQADYQAMKTRLIAKGSALAALENALKAGVFTQEEYVAKRAELMGRDPVPGTVTQAEASPAPAAEATPTPRPTLPAPPAENEAKPNATPDQNHVLRLKMARAIDQSGFERPMTSLSMLVPVDWQTQGATTWNIKDKCNTIQTNLRTSGPDGRGIEFFPAFNWVWADDPGPLRMTAAQTAQYGTRPCDVAPPMRASDFLKSNLRRYRPGAQLVGFEPAPKLLAILQQQARQGEQQAARYNLRQSIRPDAVKGRVRYTVNGRAMEEWIVVATIITGTLGPSYNTRTMQLGQAYTYNCVAYVTGERALQGQLDATEKFFDLLVGTSRINPQWQAKVTGNAQAIQSIELKGVRDRSAIVAKNAEEIGNIRRQSFENTQRTQDRTNLQFSQNMRDVETYRNPATGETIDLSNKYGQAWVNNRGEYLLSDQPGFDPSVTFKEDWKVLERVKP